MPHTPPVIRELLQTSGYAWDDDAEGWVRRGHKPDLFRGRLLDGGIAAALTPEQIRTWIKNGENK
jgi:hypothetical protein